MNIKYAFIIYMILNTFNTYSQGIHLKNKESKYPTFDKLFRLKWKIEDNNIRSGKISMKDGLVFCPGISDYYINGESGDKVYFANLIGKSDTDKILKAKVLIAYPANKKMLININTGEEITSGSGQFISSFLNQSAFLNDSIYYYPISEKLIMAKDLNRIRRVLWKFPTEDNIIYRYMKFDSTFVVFTEKKLLLLNARKGYKEWETSVGPLACAPILINNDIFFISQGPEKKITLNSINLHERKKNWSKEFESTSHYYDLAVEKDKICFVNDRGVYALNVQTGKEIFLAEGNYVNDVISIIDDLIIVYNYKLESIIIGTGIDLNTGKIKYRYFTSEGFPAKGEDDMTEEAKRMKKAGEADWWEGLGYNYLDGNETYFTKDPKTGLVYGNSRGTIYCLEYIK